LHGNTERKRGDIEKEKIGSLVGSLAGEDGSLNGSTVSNSLIGVDALVEGSSTEELGDKRLDLGNTGGPSDKDDIVNLVLGDLGVLEDLVDRDQSALEGGSVDLLETSTGDGGLEVDTVLKGVDLDGGLARIKDGSA
jgi:hypothetical protein